MATFQKDGLWIQGGAASLANVDESTPFIPGQLGKVLSVKDADGKDPAFYQYVKRYATQTYITTCATGEVCYWQDLDDFVVSAESTDAFGGTTNPIVAGVWLGVYPAAGDYGFVQVGGRASVSVTDSAAAGDRLQLATTTTDHGYLKTAAAITITSQAVSVSLPNPFYGILVDAQTVTDTAAAVTAFLSVIRNGW